MMLGLEMRKATPEDAALVQTITLDAFDRYVRKSRIMHPIAAQTETIEDITQDIETANVFVAMMFGRPAGSIRIFDEGDGVAHISRFGVSSEFRKIGVGHELMKKADEIIQTSRMKSAYLYTALSNSRLIHFYRRHGFYLDSVEGSEEYPRAKLVKKY
ncbi:MAG: GNAT family N-acetyltransferase [Clostridia bacterium]